MRNNVVTFILIVIFQQSFAQTTIKQLDSLINRGWGASGQVLPKSSCDTLYKHIIKHIKNKNTSIKSETYETLYVLYSRCKMGDSCTLIRRKIINEYFSYLEISHDSVGIYSLATRNFRSMISDLSINDKEKINAIIKNTKRYYNWLYFIKYYGFKEFIPELWEIYEKEPYDEEGRLFSYKQTAISTLIVLGDQKAIDLQKNMVWKYLNSKPKEITDLAFYSWLDNIRTTKSKAMTDLAFDLLQYSLSNNPTIIKAYDGDGDKFLTELRAESYNYLYSQIKNFPFKYKYPLAVSKENAIQLLDWYKENPNYQIKGFDD